MRNAIVCLICMTVLCGCGGGGGSSHLADLAPTALSATSTSPVTRGDWFTCTCAYLDANGAADLHDCKFGLTPTNNRVCFKYARDEDRLYAFSGTTYTWAPSGGIKPGTNTTIESAAAILDCANTTVTVGTDSITVKYKVQLKPAAATGSYSLSTECTDMEGLQSSDSWTTFGTVVVQ